MQLGWQNKRGESGSHFSRGVQDLGDVLSKIFSLRD
jgi:hypothetical protein